MSNADDLLSFSKTEEQEVEKQVSALAERGVNVVVAAGKFGDIYTHYLNKYKIMGVRLTSKFDMRRLCRTVGAQAQARIVGCFSSADPFPERTYRGPSGKLRTSVHPGDWRR